MTPAILLHGTDEEVVERLFLGLLGVHRMYLGKWLTGILYLLTAGLFGLGYLYDYWTLNGQIDEINRAGG